jgi:hypothetical protein
MSRPPHPPWFNHSNNIQWKIQVMKFIIMQFSSLSVFLLGLNIFLNTCSQTPSVYVPPQSERYYCLYI